MRTIAVAISKGGVGKTTTAVHLAAALAEAGLRVLLVDTDAQGHCATMLGADPSDGLAELLLGETTIDNAVLEVRDNLWLLPGSHALAGAARDIARTDFQPDQVLAKALEPAESRFHVCVVDCPPGWSALLVNALVAADEILAPVSMEALSVDGLGAFTRATAPIREATGLEIRHVLPTFYDRRVKKSGQLLEQLRGAFNGRLCDPIRYSVRISEAPAWHQLVWEYEPSDRAGDDYRALARRMTAA